VLPFELIGPEAEPVRGIGEEIAAALFRLRQINVVASGAAQYRLSGKARGNGAGTLRITTLLLEAATGRYVWADHYDQGAEDRFSYLDRVITRIARGVEQSLLAAEIDRACRNDRSPPNAWELTMGALRHVLSFEAAAEGMALELLDRAMELAPHDPLPAALAAWCLGLRAGHHFTPGPDAERRRASTLAARAARLGGGDPLAETLLAAGYTLAHDLTAASLHIKRALALDGGSSWAWGRSGWVEVYSGRAENAIERLQIARTLAPADSLSFLWAIGIGAAHFEATRYEQAVRWFERGLVERPTAVWNHRFLVPAYIMAGVKDEAQRRFTEFARDFPDLTIAQVRAGLPYTPGFLDRVAEGLESMGMLPS
jgi:TolB-like protein